MVQATLGGNRLLTSGPAGPSAIARFEEDMLSQPGITKVIILVGVNDFGFSNIPQADWTGPVPKPTVESMATGYKALVEKAHARGVKIFGCTVTPGAGFEFRGSRTRTWSASPKSRDKS